MNHMAAEIKERGTHKIGKVMGEFKRGKLHSGSGAKVVKRSQAVAIGLSEARKAGADIPGKRESFRQEIMARARGRKLKKRS